MMSQDQLRKTCLLLDAYKCNLEQQGYIVYLGTYFADVYNIHLGRSVIRVDLFKGTSACGVQLIYCDPLADTVEVLVDEYGPRVQISNIQFGQDGDVRYQISVEVGSQDTAIAAA